MSQLALVEQMLGAAAELPPGRLLYHIAPAAVTGPGDWEAAVVSALRSPIGTPPLAEMAKRGGKVVVLVDDGTRPTPQKQILPPLLACLNSAGVPDGNITVIVALGTHRYMSEAELGERFGEAVFSRVAVVNHAWQDPETFVDLGLTRKGTPVQVNRAAYQAGLLIGTGSIVPHVSAGWSGGAKILQPGVCSAETTARTHSMAAESGDFLGIAGRANNPLRREMERIAAAAGLDFVLNVVLDASGAPAWVGAGDFVQAHRTGVAASRKIYVRRIPEPADIVLVDARPTTVDYWQAAKAMTHGCRGVKRGGTVILVAEMPEGIAPTHPEVACHSSKSCEDIEKACRTGEIADGVASATLRLHGLIRAHCRVICVSTGMSVADKEKLGFRHADTVGDALEAALGEHGGAARVGIIECGGDVLPAPGKF